MLLSRPLSNISMKTLAQFLFCLLILTGCRSSEQDASTPSGADAARSSNTKTAASLSVKGFAPLISENCVVFAHADFSKVEIDKVKDAFQKAGETILRTLGFDDDSFQTTLKEFRIELDKLDDVVRPTFDTITKELGIREFAVIADMELIRHEVPAIVAIPWKDKTEKQRDTLRTLLNLEYSPVDFVSVGNFLILPLAAGYSSPEKAVEEWAKEMKPAPKAPIFDALKSVADAEIKVAVTIPEPVRIMTRRGAIPLGMPDEIKGLVQFAATKVEWASASVSLHEILGEKPPKNADVLLTLKTTAPRDAAQLRRLLEQAIEYGINFMRFQMDQDQSMGFQMPPLFFQFIKGLLKTLLPEVEDDTLRFRLKADRFESQHAIVSVVGLGATLLLPATNASRESGRRMVCDLNLRQIGLALLNYENARGAFPPLYTVDENGKPLHSWRVLLLPFLDYNVFYKAIRLDEPWDSDHNSQFHDVIVGIYSCQSNPLCKPGNDCTYSAIAGGILVPGTEKARTLDYLATNNGTSYTLALIEVKEPFCWMDPTADVTLKDLGKGINAPDSRCGSFHPGGCMACFCDGSVRHLSQTMDTKTLQALGNPDSSDIIDSF